MQEKNIHQLVVGPIATNCWIYKTGENEAAIIDPGDEAQIIISVLKELNLDPKYILLSHGHFDHIGAVPVLAEFFPKAEIAIHRLDGGYLGKDAYGPHSFCAKNVMGDESIIDTVMPTAKNGLPDPDRFLEEGDTIGPFTVLHLPGHTPGSAAFWAKEKSVIFTGDTLFKSGFGRTDLPEGNDRDLITSLRRLFAMDAGITVCPGHGGTTTIGAEAR